MFGCEQNLWCWMSNRGEALRSCQRAPRITLSLLLEQPICLHTNTHKQSAAYVPTMHGPRPYYNEQCHFYVCVSLKSMFAELRFELMELKSKRHKAQRRLYQWNELMTFAWVWARISFLVAPETSSHPMRLPLSSLSEKMCIRLHVLAQVSAACVSSAARPAALISISCLIGEARRHALG